jgi:hypothetical protein
MISSFIINKKPAVIVTYWFDVLWCPGLDLNRYELFVRGILSHRPACFLPFQPVSFGFRFPMRFSKSFREAFLEDLFRASPVGDVGEGIHKVGTVDSKRCWKGRELRL